ncbi:MAG TPA: patatin-like phospholipase family protein, partial [Rhizobiales bacterium]|nr:patatin-like phospholipase family protein [Hyphomicrobiales bacterium]
MSKKIGLALGGGAARGISHIPLLEAIDELGVSPVKIAGTSIGALVGAAYASGITGRELREHTTAVLANKIDAARRVFKHPK